jgi:hypothetical protein
MSFYLNRLFKEPTTKQQPKKQELPKKQQQPKQKRYNKKTLEIINAIKKNVISFIIDFDDI